MRNNIGLFLSKRAHLSPGLEAYVDSDSELRLTHPELNTRANQTANALTALGVRKGDRVALLMMNSAEFFESFFAIAKLGAIVVPVNWRLVPDELAFILKDSSARILIYESEFSEAMTELHGRGSEGTDIETWLQVGDDATRDAFAQSYADVRAQASAEEPEVTAWDDDLLFIMYTSGTIGLPKGAVHTHASAIAASTTMMATNETRLGDRNLVALPLFHVGALAPLMLNVYRGVTSIVMRSFDSVKCWELIHREKVTSGLAVPAMLNFLRQVYDPDKYDHCTLRWLMSGAAPVPVKLIEAFQSMNIEVHQVYGMTESCGPACLIGPDDAMTKAGSTGKGFFHTDIRVVNDQGEDVAPGEPGEVLVRGGHIMREYWNRPDATADTIKDGWLYSGDVAIMDEEGFVYIQDRTKDLIISGGENVYPAEVENVILGHPKVSDVAVIGQASEKWGESPLAIVVKGEESLTEAEVLAHCDGKLARFKLPRAVRFIDVIPRNPTGKVLKRVLREQYPEPAAE